MKKIFILGLALVTLQLKAQNLNYVQKSDSLSEAIADRLTQISTSFQPERTDLYLNKAWDYFMVITKSGEVLHFSGRVNVSRNFLEAKVNNRIRRVNPSSVELIINGTNKYVFAPAAEIENHDTNSIMKVLSLGEISLLEQYKIGFRRRRSNSLNPQIAATEEAFIDSRLYVSGDFKSYTVLPTRKEKILNIFEEKEPALTSYMEVNNLKLRDDTDLVNLFNYYNVISTD